MIDYDSLTNHPHAQSNAVSQKRLRKIRLNTTNTNNTARVDSMSFGFRMHLSPIGKVEIELCVQAETADTGADMVQTWCSAQLCIASIALRSQVISPPEFPEAVQDSKLEVNTQKVAMSSRQFDPMINPVRCLESRGLSKQ